MSLERRNDKGVFTAESYRQNSETIQAMRAHLDRAWANNEMAELERKVKEGEDARRKLSELQRQTPAAPVHPSYVPSTEPVQQTPYIEEVGYDHLHSSQPLPHHSQPSTSYRVEYGHVGHVSTPHGTTPFVEQRYANPANRHPHIHHQTASMSGPVASNPNPVQPVHWQGGHDFRTSSLVGAFGGTSHWKKSAAPPAVQSTSAATPNSTQPNSVHQNIVAQLESLITKNAIHNEVTTGSSQPVISQQQQQACNPFAEYKLALNFNLATNRVREWNKESVSQMLYRFQRDAFPNTHVDIPELRLRLAKLQNSTILLAIIDDQGVLIEVHEYSDRRDLPQRLQAQIAALAVNGPTISSHPFRDPLPPKELAFGSQQPSQIQTTPVFPASKHAATPRRTSPVVPAPPVLSIAPPAHAPSAEVPAASRPYAATSDLSNNGTLPNGLANAGEYNRSALPVPPPSDALNPRASSSLYHPRDAAISSSPSILDGARTPSHANKHTLARDVLRALGFSGKRGREGGSENEEERAPKKRVIDNRSSVSTTELTSSIQAIMGAPVTSTKKQNTFQSYNPYRSLVAPYTQVAQLHNATSTLSKAMLSTMPPNTQDLSTMADSRINDSSSQTTTPSLTVGTTSVMSDSSAVNAIAVSSSYPTSTQNSPLVDKDAVASSNLEVLQLTETLPIQNNGATSPPSRSPSPVDDQEGNVGSSKLPLFFRSSSTPLGDTDVDHNDAEDVHIIGPVEPLSAKAFGKRKIPYVLIPPPPTWVKESQARLERRRRNEVILEEASDDETLFVDVSGFESPAREEIDFQRHSRTQLPDEKEEAAMKICSSRLREAPCKWRDCDSILNCADKLYLHLQNHVEQNKAEKSFPCHWQHCGRVFLHKHELILHLQVHAFLPMYCAYENCEETFRTARQYLQHSLQKHQDDRLRPSADPVLLQGHMELPDVPSVVPSYMAVARSVAQYPISPERHQVIGPWTLQNIFGKVDLAPQRYNLAKPFRPGEASAAELRSRHEYDFLETKPPISSSPSRSATWESMKGVADLNSDEVTTMFKEKGIVLWGKGGDDDLVDKADQGAMNDEESVRVLLQV